MLNFKPFLLMLLIALMSGCSTLSTPIPAQQPSTLSQLQRTALLKKITHWQINGKIAFITPATKTEPVRKQSASLFWQVDEQNHQQQLNLTTFLGINVFSLKSEHGMHQIKVDGKTYQSHNLHTLIYGLSHYALPTNALGYWLKGLKLHASDQLQLDPTSQLPTQLISVTNGQVWHINYADYRLVNQLPLAHKLTISTTKLTIKLHIKQWLITP